MERDKNKILIVIDDKEHATEINDLMFFFLKLRTNNITTIIIGETDKSDKAIWEKQFTEVTVMPSEFGVNDV